MRNLYHIHVIDKNTIELRLLCINNKFSVNKNDHSFFLFFQAEVKLEYLLNLSILISKGKEIN